MEFGTGVAAVQQVYAEARRSLKENVNGSRQSESRMKILVAEPLAAAGIELLKAQPGWNIIVSNPKEYAQHLADADALLVRSAVKVNAEVLAKAPKLRVIGRAGVGVDNVDLPAATAAGVLVMNTPGGNAVSVAEHTLALMLGDGAFHSPGQRLHQVRQVGKEEVHGQRAARQDARHSRPGQHRARSGEARARFRNEDPRHDPYVTSQIAADLGVELVDLTTLYAQSDYITLHVALTPETNRMLSTRRFAKMKDGVRIVNCARGELIDDAALARGDAIRQGGGRRAGRVPERSRLRPAIRCWRWRPCWRRRTSAGPPKKRRRSSACASPSRWSSTCSAASRINAVNMPALSPSNIARWDRMWTLAERLGTFAAHIATRQSERGAADLLAARSPRATPICCATRAWPAC